MARRRSKQPDLGKILGNLISALFGSLWKQHKTSNTASARSRAASMDDDGEWGSFNTEVVGEASYKGQLHAVFGSGEGRKHFDACLEPEPTNPYDPNAIRVSINEGTVGYLSRASAKRYGKKYGARSQTCSAVIVSRKGGHGAWLDLAL
ncbi:MAG: HIRAN domain-containing protein [Luteimonas sp.]